MGENAIVPVQQVQADLAHIGSSILQRNRACCLVVLMLDKSGSMSKYGQKPLVELNWQIAALKRMPGVENTMLMVYAFAEEAPQIIMLPVLLADAQPITSYMADGQRTRLVGSVGDALHTALWLYSYAEGVYGSKPLVVFSVISDGQDNASSPEDVERERSFVRDARARGFDLQVIGIGIEGPALARVLGFDERNAQTVAGNAAGVQNASEQSIVFVSHTMSRTVVGDFVSDPGPMGSHEIDADPVTHK